MTTLFVTTGMGRWPFDRLLEAVRPLCNTYRVIVQHGPSGVALPCESHAFLTFPEVLDNIKEAAIVVCHAGNTVRLAQRLGKVPITMARQSRYGEMADDHQVAYLRHESAHGRVIPLWDGADLPDLVVNHQALAQRILNERPLPDAVRTADMVALMDRLVKKWLP